MTRPVVCALVLSGALSASGATAAPLDRALLDRYCVTCHNARLKTGGLTLDDVDLTQPASRAGVLEKVVLKLRGGQMPPPGRPRPEKVALDAFVADLETALDKAPLNPGRTAAHRLNRLEYVAAVRDLLDLEIDPALLPADDPGVGFDNNADVLSVTPGLMNRYMSAAAKVSRLAIGDPAIRPGSTVYQASEFAHQDVRMGEDFPFGTHGGLAVRHPFPLDGEYTLKLLLQRNTIGDTIRGIDDEHEIQIRLDHALVKRFAVGGRFKGFDPGLVNGIPEDDVDGRRLHTYRLSADEHLELRIPVKAGTHLVVAAFTDTVPAVREQVPLVPSSLKRSNFTDDAGDPGIERVTIVGPHVATVPADTPSRRRIFLCRPSSDRDAERCARTILGTLARRAYRREPSEADLSELMRLYRLGREDGGFESGVEFALETLLWSPAFLFRIEHDPAGALPGSVYKVSDLELAARLSFFLWKSIPDDELRDVAAQGRLREPAVLERQVRRMLADARSKRWMNDFVGQWLTVREVQGHEPDPDTFRDFDDNLRQAMTEETELFFQSQVRGNKSVLDLLRADYTFLNARLAQHYGVPGVYGSHFRRVAVTDPNRQGLLGQASILTVTSYAHRTSVVLRGKWVLETLLGSPPPPPPPNVPPLKENEAGAPPRSLRERMEQHRKSPGCATCHAPMDPLGFVLENFDATGRWREIDEGGRIDPVGVLPGGGTVEGPSGFRAYLLARSDEVARTVTRKLLEYALGRSLEYYDAPSVRKLVRQAARDDYRWSSLILGIVQSAPFQMRRVADAGPASASGNGSASVPARVGP
ncbi:MAG: hypothetical protein DMF90_04525 [Acidobacteria bacterium]|nr:MAG: hypothetical protein DMF90_04525 [Acidobacteriota bacterium]